MNNIKYVTYGFSLCFLFLVFTSCKKNRAFDNYTLLTKDTWKTENVVDIAGNSIITDCEKDDEMKFNKNNITFSEGENDCSETMFLRSADWTFKDDGKTIKIKKTFQTKKGIGATGIVLRYTIMTLNENELVLKSLDEDKIYYYEK